jgi:hypothetical protein
VSPMGRQSGYLAGLDQAAVGDGGDDLRVEKPGEAVVATGVEREEPRDRGPSRLSDSGLKRLIGRRRPFGETDLVQVVVHLDQGRTTPARVPGPAPSTAPRLVPLDSPQPDPVVAQCSPTRPPTGTQAPLGDIIKSLSSRSGNTITPGPADM